MFLAKGDGFLKAENEFKLTAEELSAGNVTKTAKFDWNGDGTYEQTVNVVVSKDVVLMKSRLLDVPAAIRLSRKTLKNIHQNLFWAFCYNTIGIPLAAGAFIALVGWQLNPMFGAAAMSLSSFCVVSNALRLNFKNIHDPSRDRKIHHKHKEEIIFEQENKTMTKTMKISGMMCPHCEARVKNN